jgi:hypothetical protein
VSSTGTMPVQVAFRNPLAEIAGVPLLAVVPRPALLSLPTSILLLSTTHLRYST